MTRFDVQTLTVPSAFADRQSRWNNPKMASHPFNLEKKAVCLFVSMSTSSGHFVPKSGVGRETGAFIYALPADENSPALVAPRHAITVLFSRCFKSPSPPRRQRDFHGNADRAYNTLHFASIVVCQ